MAGTYNTKNYFAHGGNELVIGGKLTFLEGAKVEGGDGLFDSLDGETGNAAAYQADSTATTVAALKEDFNELLGKLRAAGLMEASAPAETSDPEETPDPEGTTNTDESGSG